MNLIEHLKLCPETTPNGLNFYKDFKLIKSYTTSQLIEAAQKKAYGFAKQLPKQRSNILLSLDTGEDFILSFFGLMLAGQTPVPLCPPHLMLKKDFDVLFEKIKKAANAKSYICDRDLGNGLSRLNLVDAPECQLPQIKETDPAFIQFSSGSTQDPKGVVIRQNNLIANLQQITSGLGLGERESICSWLPLHHDMGLIGGLLSALYGYNTANLMSPVDYMINPLGWVKLMSDTRATFLCAPNSSYHVIAKKILQHPPKSIDLSAIRVAMCGAEPIAIETLERFAKALAPYGFRRQAILPVYGLAEATLAVTFSEIEQGPQVLNVDDEALKKDLVYKGPTDQNKTIKMVSCGKPLPGIKLEIRDLDGEKLGDGRQGEIWIKGENICLNYFDKEPHLEEGFLNTGDLGFTHKGNLYVTGRTKDLIIVGGKNYAPQDFEHKVAADISEIKLGRVVAVGIPDTSGTEKIHLAVESDKILSKQQMTDLKRRTALSASKICPVSQKHVYIVPMFGIPKTTSGKVQRFKTKSNINHGLFQKFERNFTRYQLQGHLIKSQFKLKFALKTLSEKLGINNAN